MLVTRHAAEHASKRRLNARGDLVVRGPGGDAVDKTTILFAIGVFQIVEKCAIGSELAAPGDTGIGLLPLPSLRAGDLDGSRIWDGSGTAAAKELQSRIEAAVIPELGRRKREMH